MRVSRWLAWVWLAVAPCVVQAKQLAIITDTGNTTGNLTTSDLVKIFNAHTRTWPDGRSITIVLRDPSSADMQLVARKLFNLTAEQARIFVQAHKGAFMIADSDEAVIHFVSTTRGAVGVIDLFSLTKDVNVLKIDGKLPVEQGYLLRGN
jgi:ABC-type phosphate transport system substrate-binding protein